MPKEFHNGSKLNKKLIASSISLTPKGVKSRTLQAVKFGGAVSMYCFEGSCKPNGGGNAY